MRKSIKEIGHLWRYDVMLDYIEIDREEKHDA